MKKQLSILLLIIIFALTFTSCTFIKSTFYKYDVSFELDGGVAGEGFVENVSVKHGETLDLITPTRENFTFEGWYDGDVLYTDGTPVEKDVTLRAKWTFNNTYTLTFETNGMADVPADHPIIGELPKIPEAPIVEGYVFAGWYLDAEYTERYFFDYPLSEATTLYAKFYDISLGEYIVISNLDQLIAINDDPAAKYLLACDINCKGETLSPINEFSGEIEGNGYRIYNFSINETADIAGFIRTNKGTIQNLSFDNFIFQIVTSSDAAEKQYGIVCGINEGTIQNCHVLNGEVSVTEHPSATKNGWFAISVGAICGWNQGKILDSVSNVDINVHSNVVLKSYSGLLRQYCQCIGGLVGVNRKNASITNAFSNGDINLTIKTSGDNRYYTEDFPRLGGIVASNGGEIEKCETYGNINIDIDNPNKDLICITHIGQFAADNNNRIENCYANGGINVNGNMISLYLGGFVSNNQGAIYNSYTVSDINVLSNVDITNVNYTYSVGGFVAENKLAEGYPATINKCFALVDITVAKNPVHSGYIAATNSGTIKDCYYAESNTFNHKTAVDGVETLEAITPTNTLGEVKAESEILTVEFLEKTLYFDRMVWFLFDGKVPELR